MGSNISAPIALPGCAPDPWERAAPRVQHWLGLASPVALEVTDGDVQVSQQ